MDLRKAFLLRINSDLWKELESWAQEDLRSVNGQIEYLLRQAMLRRKGSSSTASTPKESSGPAASNSTPAG